MVSYDHLSLTHFLGGSRKEWSRRMLEESHGTTRLYWVCFNQLRRNPSKMWTRRNSSSSICSFSFRSCYEDQEHTRTFSKNLRTQRLWFCLLKNENQVGNWIDRNWLYFRPEWIYTRHHPKMQIRRRRKGRRRRSCMREQ